MSRRRARDITFKYIYMMFYGNEDVNEAIDSILTIDSDEKESLEEDEKEYLNKVVEGLKVHKEDIDKLILSKLKNWTIDRIFKIDLAILRLATYEIMYFEDMPIKVTANEAVELAKKYGNDSSQTFVNGVLREIIKEKEN